MLIILAILCCIVHVISYIETLIGLKKIKSLKDVVITAHTLPKLSIIITACNEQDNIINTLTQLDAQDYPHLEIICINDRSTDATGKIIDSFIKQSKHPIKAIHIKTLPDGWLGKNYAAHTGSQAASGDWLLFMDADVNMKPDCIKRAMSHALDNKLDNLTVLAHYICNGFLYNIVHLVHKGHGLVIPLKPWLARSKRSKKSFNLGLFSLINKNAYVTCGGHQAVALKCIEDVNLGTLIKKHGFSQDVLNAQDSVSIEWYPTLKQFFNGLQKNTFAYINFKLVPAVLMLLAWYLLYVFPIAAIFFTHGITLYLNLASAFLMLLVYINVANFFRIPLKYIWFYPLGLVIYPYVIINSIAYYYKHKGIYWRGTFYSAQTLKDK